MPSSITKAKRRALANGCGGRWDDYLRWIAANATLPRLRPGDYRRVNLKVFPYYIAYALRHDSGVVLAIAHAERQPEYWIGRQPDDKI